MQPVKQKWELTLIPVFLIVALVMIGFLEGCKGDDNETDLNKPPVHKTQENQIINNQPNKPGEDKNNDPNAINTENPSDNTDKKSSYTGDVVICLSNNTFGWVLPCG